MSVLSMLQHIIFDIMVHVHTRQVTDECDQEKEEGMKLNMKHRSELGMAYPQDTRQVFTLHSDFASIHRALKTA